MGLVGRIARFAAVGSAAIALGACAVGAPGDDAAPATGDTEPSSRAVGAEATRIAPSTQLAFSTCPSPYVGSCATLHVPLDWSKPSGATIPVLVDRLATAKTTTARGQLWLLQGGPGGSAAGLAQLAHDIAEVAPDLDVLALEHRGVGASAGLVCSGDANATPAACAESLRATWGADGLAAFTTTNAAKDLVAVIDAARGGDATHLATFVYGVSYGTYWAHRYLQVAPEGHATGVILDSILPPEGQYLSQLDAQFDPQAEKLAATCAGDTTCAAWLGADPWTRLRSIRDSIAQDHCPGTLDASNRRVLAGLLETWEGRPYALAAMARYERCSADDVIALKNLVTVLGRRSGVTDDLASPALAYNILFSELYERPTPTLPTMSARYGDAVFPAGAVDLAATREAWPTYPIDHHVGAWATTATPMLMMNGTLDCQTPIESAQAMATHFHGAHQTFVPVPNANHGVLVQSPVKTVGAPSCGVQMTASFLRDPKAPVDTSCIEDLAPISFAGLDSEALYLFGTTSTWASLPQAAPAVRAAHVAPRWLSARRF